MPPSWRVSRHPVMQLPRWILARSFPQLPSWLQPATPRRPAPTARPYPVVARALVLVVVPPRLLTVTVRQTLTITTPVQGVCLVRRSRSRMDVARRIKVNSGGTFATAVVCGSGRRIMHAMGRATRYCPTKRLQWSRGSRTSQRYVKSVGGQPGGSSERLGPPLNVASLDGHPGRDAACGWRRPASAFFETMEPSIPIEPSSGRYPQPQAQRTAAARQKPLGNLPCDRRMER